MCLWDSWLTAHNESLYIPNGFNGVFNSHKDGPGIDVSILLPPSVEYTIRTDPIAIISEYAEAVIIELDSNTFARRNKFFICKIYRPLRSSTSGFNEVLQTLLDKITIEGLIAYILGNLNIGLLKYPNHHGLLDVVVARHCAPARRAHVSQTLISDAGPARPQCTYPACQFRPLVAFTSMYSCTWNKIICSRLLTLRVLQWWPRVSMYLPPASLQTCAASWLPKSSAHLPHTCPAVFCDCILLCLFTVFCPRLHGLCRRETPPTTPHPWRTLRPPRPHPRSVRWQ